jgi:glycerol-3-phosphate O-acyltransferase
LNFKWGRIDVRFAEPFSLKDYISQTAEARPTNWSENPSSEQTRFMLQSLSFKVLSEINSVTVIMPTAIVGTIVITLRGNGGIGEQEMLRKVNWLKRYFA